jgi:hypothetical protein
MASARRTRIGGRPSSFVLRPSSVVSRQSSVVVEIRRRSPLPRTARSHTRQRDELASSVIVERSTRDPDLRVPVRPLRGANWRSTRAWLQQDERSSSVVLRPSSFVLRRSSFVGRQSSVVSRQSSVVSRQPSAVSRQPSVVGRQSSVVVEIRRRSPLPRTARSHTRQRDELASSVIVEH